MNIQGYRMIDLQEKLDEVADRHRHPQPIDALHTRARAAIERLGLDGSKLELAVAVFGWGSDEANGSLLGLVRVASGTCVDIEEFCTNTGLHQFEIAVHTTGEMDEPVTRRSGSLGAALISALEAKQP